MGVDARSIRRRHCRTLINDTLRRAVEGEYFVQAMSNAIREDLVEYAVEKKRRGRSQQSPYRMAGYAVMTRLRPWCFALYRRSSATRKMSSIVSPSMPDCAIPMLTVTPVSCCAPL